MASEDEEPLTDREKRYLKRRQKKFDYTNDNEDKGKSPISGSDEEGKDFAKILLRDMQDLSKEIKEMILDRIKESPKIFHLGESCYIAIFHRPCNPLSHTLEGLFRDL